MTGMNFESINDCKHSGKSQNLKAAARRVGVFECIPNSECTVKCTP